ncbi:hypothetical protein DSO57_1032843 [Entomophthora muscae]|uniref:Uncharacterized protein n=1 Tax=Entomophthora muscae TaxID=34485 RepID=A0ACC2S2D7_9FUNG|nr:hypothetical protein DSO57_1032843 [Entomophthora muscae]
MGAPGSLGGRGESGERGGTYTWATRDFSSSWLLSSFLAPYFENFLHPLDLLLSPLDRTIFLRCTKKSAQKPAKPLNSLEDLAHAINEIFVLAYTSQVVNNGALDSVPTWEESLINLDYFLAWAQSHLKLIRSKQSGRATAKSLNPNLTGIDGIQKCSLGTIQSEVGLEIDEKPSKLPEITGKNSVSPNQTTG